MARLGQYRGSWLAAGVLVLAATAWSQSAAPLKTEVLSARESSRLLFNQVKPDYPAVARTNYIEGQVQVELLVGPDGHVRKAHVLHGNAILAASALQAIHHWMYRPFLTGRGPTPFCTQVKVVFDLKLRSIDREHFPATPELDLQRRVTPPTALDRPAGSTGPSVRLHVLVGDDGRAMDSSLVSGPPALFETAQASVAQWRFQPARWGNMPVPWYLDIDVPLADDESTAASSAPRKP